MAFISIFLCVLGLAGAILSFFITRKRSSNSKQLKKQHDLKPLLSSMVDDFSGDNRWETELDLAKAYLELHQNEKAKQLLKSVITHGDAHQILEARKMFTQLLKQERAT